MDLRRTCISSWVLGTFLPRLGSTATGGINQITGPLKTLDPAKVRTAFHNRAPDNGTELLFPLQPRAIIWQCKVSGACVDLPHDQEHPQRQINVWNSLPSLVRPYIPSSDGKYAGGQIQASQMEQKYTFRVCQKPPDFLARLRGDLTLFKSSGQSVGAGVSKKRTPVLTQLLRTLLFAISGGLLCCQVFIEGENSISRAPADPDEENRKKRRSRDADASNIAGRKSLT
ncbi:hypothetical protein FB451DRAFT_1192826 [Mycena latifolia]|nr:hypothetical protein FB451DRAFT_1192826 [Mycena latifolia]